MRLKYWLLYGSNHLRLTKLKKVSSLQIFISIVCERIPREHSQVIGKQTCAWHLRSQLVIGSQSSFQRSKEWNRLSGAWTQIVIILQSASGAPLQNLISRVSIINNSLVALARETQFLAPAARKRETRRRHHIRTNLQIDGMNERRVH